MPPSVPPPIAQPGYPGPSPYAHDQAPANWPIMSNTQPSAGYGGYPQYPQSNIYPPAGYGQLPTGANIHPIGNYLTYLPIGAYPASSGHNPSGPYPPIAAYSPSGGYTTGVPFPRIAAYPPPPSMGTYPPIGAYPPPSTGTCPPIGAYTPPNPVPAVSTTFQPPGDFFTTSKVEIRIGFLGGGENGIGAKV